MLSIFFASLLLLSTKLTGISTKLKFLKDLDEILLKLCLSETVPVKSRTVLGPNKGIIKKGPSGTLNLARVDPKSFLSIAPYATLQF